MATPSLVEALERWREELSLAMADGDRTAARKLQDVEQRLQEARLECERVVVAGEARERRQAAQEAAQAADERASKECRLRTLARARLKLDKELDAQMAPLLAVVFEQLRVADEMEHIEAELREYGQRYRIRDRLETFISNQLASLLGAFRRSWAMDRGRALADIEAEVLAELLHKDTKSTTKEVL